MKKIISILITVMLIMGLFSFSVFAQKPILGGGVFTASANNVIEVPIKITNNPGFWVVRIIATYDANVFEYAGYKDADYPLNFTVSDKSGKATFVMDAKQIGDLTDDGTIFTLKLKVKENTKVGRYKIDLYFDCTNYACDTVTANVEAPVVAVVCGKHNWQQNGQNEICTVCGATQQADGKIDTDTMEAPITPPDAVDDTSSSSDSNQLGETSSTPHKSDIATDEPKGVNTTVIITICVVAVLAVVVMFVLRFIKKK